MRQVTHLLLLVLNFISAIQIYVQIILHTNDILQIASSKMRTRSMMKGNSVLNILNNKIGVKTNRGETDVTSCLLLFEAAHLVRTLQGEGVCFF